MSAEVHYIHGRPTPIGHFIRVGYSGHRQLETLFDRGRFTAERVVIDAARFEAQRDLISTLWNAGTEIVLDPNVAELSSLGRYQGAFQTVTWANASRPLTHADFRGSQEGAIVREIAGFAVDRNVDAVLAPAHFVEGARDEWVTIDRRSCELLREVLDDAGGRGIGIDYQLIIPYAVLRDSAHRRAFVEALSDLPFDNLWIRVAGFGADATPVGVRRYISSLADFHVLGKPIISDCAGGLAGLGITAFGAAAGIAHGVGQKERFDTSTWSSRHKRGGGGQNGRLYFPSIDRFFKLSDTRTIMQARGARRLLACQDRECCPRGFDDMENDPKAHFLMQRRKQLLDLERIPDLRRPSRFLDHHLATADRTARQVAKLKVGDERIRKALLRTTQRLDRMRGVLEDLDRTLGNESTKSAPLVTRSPVQARKEQQGS